MTPAPAASAPLSLLPVLHGEKVRMRGGGILQRWSEWPPLTLALSPHAGERGLSAALNAAKGAATVAATVVVVPAFAPARRQWALLAPAD